MGNKALKKKFKESNLHPGKDPIGALTGARKIIKKDVKHKKKDVTRTVSRIVDDIGKTGELIEFLITYGPVLIVLGVSIRVYSVVKS